MPIGPSELAIVLAIVAFFTLIIGGYWWLAGWTARHSNAWILVFGVLAWVLTTFIGMIVFLAFVSIRKRRARAAAAA